MTQKGSPESKDSGALRINVGGVSPITGQVFDPQRDAGFLELCVRKDYGRTWRFDRYDADSQEAVFCREDESGQHAS